MRAIRNKLKSSSGVSLLFALLFFLVASMVAIVILDGSVTTAKRLRDDEVWEQDNLTLTSAGKLVKNALSETVCTVTTMTHITSGVTETTVSAAGPLADIMEYAVKRTRDSSAEYTGKFEMTADEEDSAFKKVTVRYTVMPDRAELDGVSNENDRKDSYRVTAVFTLEGSDQKLYLTAYRSIEQSTPATPDGEYIVKTDNVEWTSVTLSTKEVYD